MAEVVITITDVLGRYILGLMPFLLMVGLLLGLALGRFISVENIDVYIRRTLLVGFVLLLIGTFLGGPGLLTIITAVISFIGLVVVGFGIGLFLYLTLWLKNEVAKIKLALSKHENRESSN